MKVIDLLNKIANGEEIPKKVVDITRGIFIESTEEYDLYNKLYEEDIYINDEVEIIEEQKKIPEKLENEHEFYSYTKYEENKNEIDKVLYILKAINLAEEKIDNLNNSINSIIDYLESKGE